MTHDPLCDHSVNHPMDNHGNRPSEEVESNSSRGNHDPLCPRPDCDYGEPDGECMGYEDCWHRCVCDVIARVRADERERAAQRVEALKPDRIFTAGGIGYCDALREAIAAVRGEN